MSDPQVKAMVSMLAKEVAKRAMMVGTTAPALAQLSHTLLGELSIPMPPAAREEFTQAITGMVGMDESQVEARVVALLTPEKSPALFEAVFGD